MWTRRATLVLLTVVLPGCPEEAGTATAPTATAGERSAPASTASTAAPTASAAPAAPPVASNVPAKLEGANLNMGESTVDGLAMKDIQCQSDAGLFGGVALLGGLAKQKDALAACGKDPATARVHFAFEGGKTSDVRVAEVADAARCVHDAVAAATFPGKGACVLSVAVGGKAQ